MFGVRPTCRCTCQRLFRGPRCQFSGTQSEATGVSNTISASRTLLITRRSFTDSVTVTSTATSTVSASRSGSATTTMTCTATFTMTLTASVSKGNRTATAVERPTATPTRSLTKSIALCNVVVDCNDHAVNVSGSRPACACTCTYGWNGPSCGNRGTCTSLECSSHDLYVTGNIPACNCTCKYDWAGTACQAAAPCTNDDCNTHATRVTGSRPRCNCTCSHDWTGASCAAAAQCTNASDCSGRAVTISGYRPLCQCQCQYDFAGTSCEAAALCTNSDDCFGRAVTVGGYRPFCLCDCSFLYAGRRCERAATCTNADDCSNHATSVRGFRPFCNCTCAYDWSGEDCESAATCTKLDDCSNHSVSINEKRPHCVCVCEYDWSGAKCQAPAPCQRSMDCSDEGTESVTGLRPWCRCACRAGWTGMRCHVPFGPCPAVSMLLSPDTAILPASVITDGTLRLNLTIARPSNVSWAAGAAPRVWAPSSSEPNGFDRSANRTLSCRVTVDGTTLACVFSPSPQYSLLVGEVLSVSVSEVLFTPRCELASSYVGSIALSAVSPNTLAAALQAVGAAATGGASILAILSGASAVDVQAVIVLFQSDCASGLDKESTNLLRYFLSPLAGAGPFMALVGNLAICCAVTAGQLLLVKFLQKTRRISMLDASAALRFPSVAYAVTQLLYIGVCFFAFQLVSAEDLSTTNLAVGLVGIAWSIVTVVLVLTTVLRTVAKYVEYTQFLSKKSSVKWLYPTGFWDPEAKRSAYGRMFGFCRGGRKQWAPYTLIVSLLLTAIAVLLPRKISCTARLGLLAALFAGVTILLFSLRPHRAPASSVAAGISYAILCVMSIVMLLSQLNPSDSIELFKQVLLMVLIVVVLVRAMYEGCVYFLEAKRWVHFRNPAIEDLEADELREANSRPLLQATEDEADLMVNLSRVQKGEEMTVVTLVPVHTPSNRVSKLPPDGVISSSESPVAPTALSLVTIPASSNMQPTVSPSAVTTINNPLAAAVNPLLGVNPTMPNASRSELLHSASSNPFALPVAPTTTVPVTPSTSQTNPLSKTTIIPTPFAATSTRAPLDVALPQGKLTVPGTPFAPQTNPLSKATVIPSPFAAITTRAPLDLALPLGNLAKAPTVPSPFATTGPQSHVTVPTTVPVTPFAPQTNPLSKATVPLPLALTVIPSPVAETTTRAPLDLAMPLGNPFAKSFLPTPTNHFPRSIAGLAAVPPTTTFAQPSKGLDDLL